MLEIRRGCAAEYEEIIDFIDLVFSKNSVPHDFPKMYPNLYRPTDKSMRNLINLWEDGKIVTSVLVYPRVLCIGGERLGVYGIGSVSTHPRERGKGYMSRVLKFCNEEMKKEGVALSNLGGRRSRYNRFGFEVGGNGYSYEFDGEDATDAFPDFDAGIYRFAPFSYNDTSTVQELMTIYNSKPVHYDYDFDDFFLRLIIPHDGAYPLAVYSEDKLLGYVAVCPEDDGERFDIREICLCDDSLMADVLMSLAVTKDCCLRVTLASYQLPFMQKLFDIGSNLRFGCMGMWKVFDWQRVIKALLTHKSEYTDLLHGRLVFDIENAGRFAVQFDGTVSVEQTGDEADFTVSELRAVRALLGSAPEGVFGLGLNAETAALVNSWLPLPLTCFHTERV